MGWGMFSISSWSTGTENGFYDVTVPTFTVVFILLVATGVLLPVVSKFLPVISFDVYVSASLKFDFRVSSILPVRLFFLE